MNTDSPTQSKLAQKILKQLSGATNKTEYQVITKNQFSDETLENFFQVLTELKQSGLVSFYEEYSYVPYQRFGDLTPKHYGKMDILLKINPQ